MNITNTKTCIKCHKTKPLDEFYNQKDGKDGKGSYCKKCSKECSKKYRENHREESKQYRENHREENKEYQQEHKDEIRKRKGSISMYENKLCSAYLGVVIAERLCRHMFKDVEVMPYGNTGFDIICNKGKKIDVKSGCTTLTPSKNSQWQFKINHNVTADYFILVAFDNRTDLNPLHLWMIPGREINHRASKSIRPSTIHKWDKWKRDIKNAELCCTEMKERNHEI